MTALDQYADPEALAERLEHHPRRETIWDRAYELGHSDGCARIAREYAQMAELLN